MYSFDLANILEILKSGWEDFIATDFNQIHYADSKLAVWVGIILIFLIAVKLLFLLFGRNKYARADSGHLIYGRYRKGLLVRLLMVLPILSLVFILTAVLFAISGPFFTATKNEKKYIETRTRVDVQDVSGSMTSISGDVKSGDGYKTKAEVSMDAHLKFLEMRRGKKDRTSFWIFSDNAFLKQDFTVDDDLFYFQVYDAPWELGGNPRDAFSWDQVPFSYYPKSRYQQIPGEGGTQMSSVLKAVVRQFDEDDARQKKATNYRASVGRALLILTDAEISDFDSSKKEIEELRIRKVIIYIILIKEPPPPPSPPSPPPPPQEPGAPDPESSDSPEGGGSAYQSQAEQVTSNPLLDEIVRQGGAFFPVSSESSLLSAYREIDRLEKVKTVVENKVFKVPIFYKFVFIGIVSLSLVLLGLFTVYLLEYP